MRDKIYLTVLNYIDYKDKLSIGSEELNVLEEGDKYYVVDLDEDEPALPEEYISKVFDEDAFCLNRPIYFSENLYSHYVLGVLTEEKEEGTKLIKKLFNDILDEKEKHIKKIKKMI